jgi:hypothetical protein
MRTAPHSAVFATVAVLALACAETSPPTDPADAGPRIAGAVTGEVVTFDIYTLTCPDGIKQAQLQSIYPLNPSGNLVLVGRSGCPGTSEDFQVFDLSSGTPVMLDAYDTGEPGFNLGVHSPAGSPVGFGVEGAALVGFSPQAGFSEVPIPCVGVCSAWSVWANTANDVWVAGDGQIARFHNGVWTIEYVGFLVRDIWGFAGNPPVIYAAGSGILRRLPNGTWQEALSPAAIPPTCTSGFWSIHGSSPADIWTTGTGDCVVRGAGTHWFQTTAPGVGAFGGVWALDSQHVIVASQGNVDLTLGRIAVWGSADGGATWMQLTDPLFTTLPTVTDASFFNMAASPDGSRIYLPSIAGTLIVGSVNWAAMAAAGAAPGAGSPAAAPVSPEY